MTSQTPSTGVCVCGGWLVGLLVRQLVQVCKYQRADTTASSAMLRRAKVQPGPTDNQLEVTFVDAKV
jgi:hypothetical protein